ncbi:unnamed protein product [Meloidogyne enterolobii]|uniref:Uncharacterized protein n=1 Tax=Meloidogyne enterolobii TaxID=390850 RepID=A0ACB1ACE6_MELEN
MAIKNKNKAKNSKKSKAKKSKARKALNIQEAMEFAGQAMECTNLEENTWEAVADQVRLVKFKREIFIFLERFFEFKNSIFEVKVNF